MTRSETRTLRTATGVEVAITCELSAQPCDHIGGLVLSCGDDFHQAECQRCGARLDNEEVAALAAAARQAIRGEEPCAWCGHRFDHHLLGPVGCPNCHGEGLE